MIVPSIPWAEALGSALAGRPLPYVILLESAAGQATCEPDVQQRD
jgi:hypothetical protein